MAEASLNKTMLRTAIAWETIANRIFAAGHQPFDVDQNQHALIHGGQTNEILGIERRTKFRHRLDLLRQKRNDIRDTINDYADNTLGDIQNDDDGELVIFNIAQVKFNAQIDDRNDIAA